MADFFPAAATAGQSSDFTIADGASNTLFLTDAAGPTVAEDALVDIQIKSDGGEYFTIGSLTYSHPAYVLAAPGTYRLNRHAGTSVGVHKA